MSYTQLCKQWERESIKKNKQEREERKRQQKQTDIFKFEIYLAKERQEKQEKKEKEEKQEKVINAKDNITLALRKHNSFTFNQYLIIWDILNYDYDQIYASLHKNRITKLDITNAINYIKNFSKEIISNYWEEKLLSL